jgi:hypothetical protein
VGVESYLQEQFGKAGIAPERVSLARETYTFRFAGKPAKCMVQGENEIPARPPVLPILTDRPAASTAGIVMVFRSGILPDRFAFRNPVGAGAAVSEKSSK